MNEPKARAAESGEQNNAHVTVRRSPRSGEPPVSTRPIAKTSRTDFGWMVYR
jgi:hypothetical protein